MRTIRQVLASLSHDWKWEKWVPSTASPGDYYMSLRWHGEIVGELHYMKSRGEYYVTALNACRGKNAWTEVYQGTDKATAQEAAMSCPKCGDSPCQALTEPTEEVSKP